MRKDQFLLEDSYSIIIKETSRKILRKEILNDEHSENIIFTQVVPSPKSDLTAAQDYREDLNKYSPGSQPSYGSFEGYLDAKLFVVGLTEAIAKNALTREGLVDAFESLQNIDIGIGLKISFDKNHHQALHTIWPTIIKNGQIMPLDWSKLKMPN